MTSEGGCALVIARADRIDSSVKPVHLLGAEPTSSARTQGAPSVGLSRADR